jgi:CelD/BcsL family acetyltransferase involved in cellulose biosynthesis
MAWKTEQCQRNNWSSPLGELWVAEVFEHLLDMDGGRFHGVLSIMYAGDKPVSAHFDLRADTTFAIWLLAYDTESARWSPGLLHNLQLAEHAARDGVTKVNFGRGTEQYKELLSTDALQVARGIAARGPLHGLSEAALAWAHRHKHFLPGGSAGLRDRPQLEG